MDFLSVMLISFCKWHNKMQAEFILFQEYDKEEEVLP